MIKRRSTINLLIILVLGLCPLLWFKSGFLIKSEDIGIPLNYGEWTNYLFSWFGQRATGTYPVDNFAALFFLFLPAFLQKVGLSLITSEKIQFIFWFMASGLSFYYLLVAIYKGKHPPLFVNLVATGFYMFNLYLEPIWLGFNIANLSAYVGLPLLAGLFINGLRTGRVMKYVFLAGLVGVAMSGVGVNPPIMYVCGVFCVLWLIFNFILHVLAKGDIKFKKFIIFSFLFFVVITAVNIFWIYPQAKRLTKMTNAESQITQYKATVSDGIREISNNTSLFNVLRFQAAWTWYEEYEDDPYCLYSEHYQKNAFLIFMSVIPAIIVFLSCFNFKRRPSGMFFASIALLGVIYSVGLHNPLIWINSFCIKYIPGFWMIRSPWYKWSLLTALGFAVCLGCVMDYIYHKFKRKIFIAYLNGIVLFLIILLYAYPIFTGRMFSSPQERHYVPPQHVKIPDYVFKASEWFNNQDDFYRIMLLHSNARRITEWGYSGYEPVLAYFTDKPLIVPIMTESYGSPYAIPNYKNKLYEWLYIDTQDKSYRDSLANVKKQNSDKIALSILPMFNIKYLLYEGDIRWNFYNHYESPEFLGSKLALQKGVSLVAQFGKWKIYEIGDQLQHIYTAGKINILDGDLEMLEALSRTDLLTFNNVFSHDISKTFGDFLEDNNLIDKIFIYNKTDFSNNAPNDCHLLLSTNNREIFLINDVPDLVARKKIKMKFKKGTYGAYQVKGQNYYSFNNADSPIEAIMTNTSNLDMLVNLKLNFLNGIDKFIDIYLNEHLIKKVYVKKGANNEIKIESLLIKPGLNYINFSAPPSQDRSITALYSDIDFYSHEFSVTADFAKSGSYYVELYAFPLNQVDYLTKDKGMHINKTKYSLNYKDSDTSYVLTNKVKFIKGENVISFLRQKQENYYLFIKPKASAQDSSQIEIKSEFINPVKYKVELKAPDDRYTFLFFNEAYDENWKAISKQSKSAIGNHFIANGYANAWALNGLQNDGQTKCLMLKYSVQDQFYVGLIISFSVMICCFIGLFIILFRGLKNKRI